MSLAIACQFLCIVTVNSLPISEKGVIMWIIFVTVCGVRWDNKLLRFWVKAFFMFLMMRCSGYVRVCVRLLSSSWRMWSSEISCCIEVLVNKWYLYSWVGGKSRNEVVSWSQLVFKEFCLEFSGFRKVDLHVFSLLMFLSYLTYVLRSITQFTYFESSHNY